MKIEKITLIIQQHQADFITLHTNLPEACYPYEGNLDMTFRVAWTHGEDYIKTHFPGIPLEIIDLRETRINILYSEN